jgi:hypothetical protein
MKNKKTNINEIVSKNLKKQYHINETFETIFLNENTDTQFNETIQYFGKLIDEGYTDDELKSFINEQFDWIKKLFSSEKPTTASSTQDTLLKSATSGAFSQFKEYLIKRFLGAVGFEGPLASAISTALSEMTIADLISVFRNRQSCMSQSGVVAKAIIEAIVTYIIENNTSEDSLSRNFIRNTLSEYLSNQGYMKKIGQFICNFTYKSKDAMLSKMSL